MFVYMLQGATRGQPLFVADTYAAKGIADGWCVDLTNRPYPYQVPAIVPKPLPASYTEWVDAGMPAKEPGEEPPEPPPLTLTAINPNTAVAGGEDIVISCAGTGFTDATLVNVNGVDQEATFASSSEIFTPIYASLAVVGSVDVYAHEGGVSSAILQFTFTETEVVAFTGITNENPARIVFGGQLDADKFAEGNVVTISGTGNATVDGTDQTLGTKSVNFYDLAGLDLSGEAAPLNGGTATLKTTPPARGAEKKRRG